MSRIQSILFEKGDGGWEIDDVLEWFDKRHLYPIKPIRETEHNFRARMKDPKDFRFFVTKEIGNHIKLVIGFY